MKSGQDAGKYRQRAARASIRDIEDEEEDYAADAAVADEELEEHWHINTLETLKEVYLEHNCDMCKNVVPGEGIVIRKEKLNLYEAYKLKSFRFLEHETKMLDDGESTEEELVVDEEST